MIGQITQFLSLAVRHLLCVSYEVAVTYFYYVVKEVKVTNVVSKGTGF